MNHYRWLPDAEIVKIRNLSPRLGWLSILFGLILGIAVVIVGVQVSTFDSSAVVVNLVVSVIPATFLLISAKVMFSLRLWVQSGYLNWRQSHNSQVGLSCLFAGAMMLPWIFFGLFGAFDFVLTDTPSAGLALYLPLQVLPLIPLSLNMWFVGRIVRLSNESYRLYGAVPWQYLSG